MVAEAKRRSAIEDVGDRCRFRLVDAADLQLRRQFDRVLCVTVLQHILDAARLQHAVERMREHLALRGRMILLEAAPSTPVTRCNTSSFVARTESDYREVFDRAGLSCLHTIGVDPFPLKTYVLPRYRLRPRPIALCELFFTTLLSLPIDLATSPWLTAASWHKVFVLARREDMS
jgi:hypothetical protein